MHGEEPMPIEQTYRDKTFEIADSDSRIRNDDLISFAIYKAGDALAPGTKIGDLKRIAVKTRVSVAQVKVLPTGSQNVRIFAQAASTAGVIIGWTATTNFAGKFANETLGLLTPAPTDDQFGPNAAWSQGNFLGQVDLVQIVDTYGQIKRVTL